MSWLYCIVFMEYMKIGKGLLEYNNLSSPNNSRKNDKIMKMYFKSNYECRKKIMSFKLEKDF